MAFLLAPLVAALPNAQASLSVSGLIGELAVGLVYGLSLTLLNEMLLFAGQIAGLQFSFSLVNLLDPDSAIQTPLLGDLFQDGHAGGDYRGPRPDSAGLGGAQLSRGASGQLRSGRALGRILVRAAGGVFLAALELAAPVLAATMLVEIAVALLGKLSPQLPVMLLTVPLKTLTGFAILIGSLALWPRFIEARFAGLLDMAERLIAAPRTRRAGWEANRCPASAPNRPRSTAARRRARKATSCTAASCRRRRARWPE